MQTKLSTQDYMDFLQRFILVHSYIYSIDVLNKIECYI